MRGDSVRRTATTAPGRTTTTCAQQPRKRTMQTNKRSNQQARNKQTSKQARYKQGSKQTSARYEQGSKRPTVRWLADGGSPAQIGGFKLADARDGIRQRRAVPRARRRERRTRRRRVQPDVAAAGACVAGTTRHVRSAPALLVQRPTRRPTCRCGAVGSRVGRERWDWAAGSCITQRTRGSTGRAHGYGVLGRDWRCRRAGGGTRTSGSTTPGTPASTRGKRRSRGRGVPGPAVRATSRRGMRPDVAIGDRSTHRQCS